MQRVGHPNDQLGALVFIWKTSEKQALSHYKFPNLCSLMLDFIDFLGAVSGSLDLDEGAHVSVLLLTVFTLLFCKL